MNKPDWEKWIEAIENSSGHKKVLAYINEIFKSDYFLDTVNKIRTDYGIPKNGFKSKTHRYFPPKQWIGCTDTVLAKDYRQEIHKLAQRYNLHFLDASDAFDNFIFYNATDFPFSADAFNLCMTSDVVAEKLDPFTKEVRDDDDRLYPIALKISPYASLRDIIDYIKRVYKYEILFLQNKYKDENIKINKFKKKKTTISERNDFIYKNRSLPKKKLQKILAEKFGADNLIDHGYIAKIISLETKKRKKL